MTDPLHQFIAAARRPGIEADDLQLAEALWLLLRIPAPEAAPETGLSQAAGAREGLGPPPGPLPGLPPQDLPAAPEAARADGGASLYADAARAGGKVRASRVRVAGVPALPGAAEINRALRPLLRRVESRRRRALDEDETIRLSAESGCVIPVFRGEPERRFDAALVAEEKPSMSVWRATLREFQRLLERHGAFGDVRFYWARTAAVAGREVEQLVSNSKAVHPPGAIHDPLGRRVVFYFTDGASPRWRTGAAARLLAAWSARMPVVLVQMLSPHLWPGTALGRPAALASAPAPGAPHAALRVAPPAWLEVDIETELRRGRFVALPAVTLDARWLAPWAAMLMGGRAPMPAWLLERRGEQAVTPLLPGTLPETPPGTPAERVARFRHLVSPAAFRLAGFLSLVPLHMPVMRMVQRLMLPESRLEHLSEFLLGGLVRHDEAPGLPLDAGEAAFEFLDEELRDLLMESDVRRHELLRVLKKLSEYVEREYGIACDFRALIAKEDGALEVPERALPFARVAARALGKFGVTPPALPPPGPGLSQGLDDPAKAEAAARALAEKAQGGDRPAYEALRKGLLGNRGQARAAIFRGVASVDHPPMLLDLIRDLIQLREHREADGSARPVVALLEQAGDTELLLQLLASGEESIADRIAAAEALGRLGEASRLGELPALLLPMMPATLGQPDLCLAIIRAYSAIGGLAALRDLRKTFFYDQSEPPSQRVLPAIERVIRELEFGDRGLLVHDFTVVKLDEMGSEIQRYERSTGYFEDDLGADVAIKLAAIPGGDFLMGSPTGEGSDLERPQHRVAVPPFFMGMHQVTQAQWRAVAHLPRVERDLKPEPSRFKGDNRPVEQVNWDDAREFCRRLSNATGRDYRLPSEAEWEYACRAGTDTPFHFGPTATTDFINADGNYPYGNAPKGVYREETTPVGHFNVANDFGLFDMHGNVWEWCEDEWHDSYDSPDRPDDGSAWVRESVAKKDEGVIAKVVKRVRRKVDSEDVKNVHVLRGGSWINDFDDCRSACRDFVRFVAVNYDFGFRVVVSARAM